MRIAHDRLAAASVVPTAATARAEALATPTPTPMSLRPKVLGHAPARADAPGRGAPSAGPRTCDDTLVSGRDPRGARAVPRPDPSDAGAPELDGAYAVRRRIGRGGFADVFEAEHRRLGRRCALKVLRREHAARADLAARLRDEARWLASVRHPNVVAVFDAGEAIDGRPFIAMELLDGRDLRADLARHGALAVPTALRVVAQALDGAAALHARGIVHGDVKLENVLFCDDGSVKLVDLGAATPIGRTAAARFPTGAQGTPRSMAPEQKSGGAADPRWDVYAAGVMLHELVTGRSPAGARAAGAAGEAAKGRAPASAIAPQHVPRALDGLILRALDPDPEERFPTATEMAAACRTVLLQQVRRRGRPSGTP